MEFSGMRLLAPDIGLVGMEPPQSNCASVDYCTTKKHILVTGPTTLKDAKNTVSFFEITEENFQKIIFFFFSALCNEDANGNVALGKSCNRYWQCQGGYPRLQRCPAMLVFDRRSLRCVVPPTEDCDIPSTIPPPPPEEEGDENIPQNNPKFANLPPGAIPVPSKSRN